MLLSEMDRIEAEEKYNLLACLVAAAPTFGDKDEFFKSYQINLVNRMNAGDDKTRADLIHAIQISDSSRQNELDQLG